MKNELLEAIARLSGNAMNNKINDHIDNDDDETI